MDKIEIKLEDNESFIDCNYCFIIFLNNEIIGDMIGYATNEDIYLELFNIDEGYRNKGYGTIALNQLLEFCKLLNIKYLHGECKNSLISFYKKFGADFTPRDGKDKEYINNRFYIDL